MSAPPRTYIEWEDAGGVAVVRFTTAVLRDERMIRAVFDHLEELIAAGRSRMVINFTGIEAFASFAIGKLIRLNERLRGDAGRLALCALTPIVEEIVDIMNLRRVFAIYPTERAALESFVAAG
jgi:anti-sigma B factor antagonist